MAPATHDSVSLSDVEEALRQVEAEKIRLRQAIEVQEAEEARLRAFAESLRDFLGRRRLLEPHPLDLAASTAAKIKRQTDAMHQTITGETPGVGKTPGIVERAVEELKKRSPGDTLDTRPLIREMQQSGYTSAAQDVYLSVYGTLNRAAARPDSPIVKLGSRWGLREWYPDGIPEVNQEEEDSANADV